MFNIRSERTRITCAIIPHLKYSEVSDGVWGLEVRQQAPDGPRMALGEPQAPLCSESVLLFTLLFSLTILCSVS